MAGESVAALDIGGTHVTAARIDPTAWQVLPGTLHRRSVDSDADAAEVVESIAAAARSAGAGYGTSWGVAMPGPFDYEHGIGRFEGTGKFASLRNVPLGELLRRSGVGAGGDIHFVNDAEAFAVGEWASGAACGHQRVVATTLGTGVGSAFIVAGVPVQHGPGVPAQGRLDLLRIDGRPLEDTMSRAAIRARYAALAGAAEQPLDVRDIAALARAGDDDAQRAIALPLHELGRVLGPRVRAFGASVVVVGGSISSAWDLVRPALQAGMDDAAPGWSRSCSLRQARQVDVAALIGAARSALATRAGECTAERP